MLHQNNIGPDEALDQPPAPGSPVHAEGGPEGCTCEFCGEGLANLGLAFHDHLDQSDTCRWVWKKQLPFVREDAGSD